MRTLTEQGKHTVIPLWSGRVANSRYLRNRSQNWSSRVGIVAEVVQPAVDAFTPLPGCVEREREVGIRLRRLYRFPAVFRAFGRCRSRHALFPRRRDCCSNSCSRAGTLRLAVNIPLVFQSYPTRIRTWTNRTKICCAAVTLSGIAVASWVIRQPLLHLRCPI